MSVASFSGGAPGQVPPQCPVTTGRLDSSAQLRKTVFTPEGGASISSRAQTLISALFLEETGLLALG